MDLPPPQRPDRLPDYTEVCLQALVERNLARHILLGGGLGLADRKVFSFRVAARSAQLEPSGTLPWIDVPLDSFSDLVAGKMVALVERGAPRDFRDIHALCEAKLVSPDDCWSLWLRRQEIAGSDTDMRRARLAVTTHLARIAQHRRLDQVSDPVAREQAAAVRAWFAVTLLAAKSGDMP